MDPDREVLVTKDMIHIEDWKLRDLKHYSPEDRRRMVQATATELSQLCDIGAFALVDQHLTKPIGSNLVYRIKYSANGEYIKHKARLVALGFQGELGRDFFSTFSPMSSMTSIRILLTIAVRYKLPIYIADVPNAFIRSYINALTQLALPSGVSFVHQGRSTDPKSSRPLGIRLIRALYGLKQSPQEWNKRLASDLMAYGFIRMHSDTSVFCKRHDDGTFIVVATEVDDLLIIASNQQRIDEFHHYLKQTYQITEFGKIDSYFGIRFRHDLDHGTLSMDMTVKIQDFFKKHPKLSTVSLHLSPSPSDDTILDESSPKSDVETYILDNYRSIVGFLIFPSITVRPDFAYEVARAARVMHAPTRQGIHRLIHFLGYVLHTATAKLIYRRADTAAHRHFQNLPDFVTCVGQPLAPAELQSDRIIGFTDANFAPKDEPRRRSTSGYCFFLYGNLVSWKSKLQPITAGSTHDAELIAGALASDESAWLRKWLVELSSLLQLPSLLVSNAANLLGDNLASVFTANNPVTSTRSRHLDVRYF